jgi:hypothetical protein
MKTLFTAFAFSVLLLSGCNSFNTVMDKVTPCGYCNYENRSYGPDYITAYYTNTSPNKYLEVTFKNGEENIFKKIKPGETIEICAYCNKQPPVVVREREITNE